MPPSACGGVFFSHDVLEPSFPCGAQLRLLKNAGRDALQGSPAASQSAHLKGVRFSYS
jgi:hypothetical protein